MILTLIWVLILLLVAGVIIWCIQRLVLPQPWGTVASVVVGLILPLANPEPATAGTVPLASGSAAVNDRERRWGMMWLAKDFDGALLATFLPDGHRILASKLDPADSFDYHIIEGPDMPVVHAGAYPEPVDLLYYIDDSGIEYGYWGHKQEHRWPLTA